MATHSSTLAWKIAWIEEPVGLQRVAKSQTRLNTHSSVQSPSRVRLFTTPWTAERQASLSIINSQSLLKLMAIELVMPSNHLILCYPLLLLPSIFPSIRVISNVSVLHNRWPKYWSFSFTSSEYSGLISFRPQFSLSSFTFLKRLFNSFSLSAIRVVSSAYLRLLINFSRQSLI